MNTAQNSLSSLVVNDDILQTKTNLFFRELQDLGFPQGQIQTLGEQLIALSTEHLMVKVSLLMNKDEFDKWKKFVDTGANSAQQTLVMSKFLEKKIDKDFDTLQTEIATDLMGNILDSLRERQDFVIKISKLNENQVNKALELLNSNQFDQLEELLDNN